MITAARTQKETEIFGMPVRFAHQPEQNFRLQDDFLILGRVIAALEQIENLDDPPSL